MSRFKQGDTLVPIKSSKSSNCHNIENLKEVKFIEDCGKDIIKVQIIKGYTMKSNSYTEHQYANKDKRGQNSSTNIIHVYAKSFKVKGENYNTLTIKDTEKLAIGTKLIPNPLSKTSHYFKLENLEEVELAVKGRSNKTYKNDKPTIKVKITKLKNNTKKLNRNETGYFTDTSRTYKLDGYYSHNFTLNKTINVYPKDFILKESVIIDDYSII